MTGQLILTDILALCDKNSSDTGYRALALKWYDLVLKDISNRQEGYHWRFLEIIDDFNTAAADFDYALSTIAPSIDTTKVIHVYDKTDDRTYTFVPYERFRRNVADETNSTGEPYIFSIFSDDLLLYPVPTAVVKTYIDYVQIIPDGLDSSAVSLIPDKYKDVLIKGILKWAFQFDKTLGDWQAMALDYESGMQRMITDNHEIISEVVQPVSHRNRFLSKAYTLDDETI